MKRVRNKVDNVAMHQFALHDPYAELSLRDARERFLMLNNFPADGGVYGSLVYGKDWALRAAGL